MKIFMNTMLPENYSDDLGELEINKQQFTKMMDIKKYAQTYGRDGVKEVVIKDNQIKLNNKPTRIRFDNMKGPFAVVLFTTKDDYNSNYVYKGFVLIEAGDRVKVFRDSIEHGYTEALFCDDTTMLMQVLDKTNNSTRYLQIAGEPTNAELWKHEGTKELNYKENAMYVENTVQMVKDKLELDKVYAVIQLA